MRVLIYHSKQNSIDNLIKLLRKGGFQTETCQLKEHFLYLNRRSDYQANLTIHDQDPQELINLFGDWKEQNSGGSFIAITKRQSVWERAQCLDAGIEHYFIEPYSYLNLLQTLIIQNYRRQLNQRTSLKTTHFELDLNTRQARCDNHQLTLTPKEFSLLAHLLQHRGEVLGRIEIQEELTGLDNDGFSNSVDVLVHRLRHKLPAEERHLVQAVYGIGYRLNQEG
jgi:two-component system OmpR family response regulator